MARLQGITGGLSGKMGSAVFRQAGGQTIATQYQPVVKNPNTGGQQAQRAKFKLMSQLAAIMAPGFGTLGTIKRAGHAAPSQRNAFTQLNFPLVEVETVGEEVTATIPMEQLQLTSSFRNLPAPSLGGRGSEITYEMHGINTEVATVRTVTVGYAGGVASIVNIKDFPVTNQNIADVTIEVPNAGGKYTVLSFGLIPTESLAGSVSLDNIHTPADEDFISAVELNAMVMDGQMVETMTVGDNITLGA